MKSPWNATGCRTVVYFGVVISALLLFVSSDGAARENTPPRAMISLPGLEWQLEPQLPGFVLLEQETDPRARARRLVFSHESRLHFVTFYLDRDNWGKSEEELRAESWEQIRSIPSDRRDVLFTETGGRALVEFFLEDEIEGKAAHQKNVYVYFGHDNVAVSVHASSAFFQDEDQAWLDALLGSLEPVTSAGSPYVDPRGRFELVLPKGWDFVATEPESDSALFLANWAQVTVGFVDKASNISDLAGTLESVARRDLGELRAVESRDFAAAGGPGRVVVYEVRETQQVVLVGGVVLEGGALSVMVIPQGKVEPDKIIEALETVASLTQ